MRPARQGRLESLLIGLLGEPEFGQALFGFLSARVPCDQCAVFRFDQESEPSIIAAGDARGTGVPLQLGMRYIRRFWKSDPVSSKVLSTHKPGRRLIALLKSAEIELTEYRLSFYRNNGLSERLSILWDDQAGTVACNLYRGQPSSFADDEIGRAIELSGFLQALVFKHERLLREGADSTSPEDIALRLRSIAPRLTLRESDVCARIICGLSSEGIALDLGISINSVLTHRRLAYRRLGISSQNELYRFFYRSSLETCNQPGSG